jgi:hypothetical protein
MASQILNLGACMEVNGARMHFGDCLEAAEKTPDCNFSVVQTVALF